ncbi:OTU domain-containing protein 4 [Elysia marginata]|uniref:OTU domain-containing protein 4 n=1 Tax=Elysia marginata TaxID=1093978 RepID=A0AAV4FHH1_9GAST|nr:OTU domain-containing protein 4 [Elysia marginata]
MDAFLAELGLYRKAIAKDGSCIFRAVSEKLFLTQAHHGKVKDTYLEHMSKHVDEYQSFVDEDLNIRLEGLDKGEIQPGLIEMAVLSRIYRLDFFVFHAPDQEPFNITQNNFSQEVYLCFVGGSQYDLVYSKSVLQTAALCQSVLYEILYRDVFQLDSELDEAVLFLELQKELPRNNNLRDTLDRVRDAIRRKRPGLFRRGVVLQHDNATTHSTNLTQRWLQCYGCEVLPHLAHSPYPTPSDFHLFGHLNCHFGGVAFENEDDLVGELKKWFPLLDLDFFRVGIYSLLSH